MRFKLPMHGRTHRPGGSDPITGFIAYLTHNIGSWLRIETTSFDPTTGSGLRLETSNAFPIDVETDGGSVNVQTNGGALNLKTDGAVSGAIDIEAGAGSVTIGGDQTTIDATNNVRVRIDTAKSVIVQNNSNVAIFRIDEDGSVHMKTGATITADL